MVVATLSYDGAAHLTVVWYGFTPEGHIGFTVPSSSQKVRNLARDPRISVLVDSGDDHGSLRGVQVVGLANLDDTPETKLVIHRSVAARYPAKPTADVDASMRRRLAVIIEPHRVVSWDHRKLRST